MKSHNTLILNKKPQLIYLNIVDNTTITNIKGVHEKHKDDGFKGGFVGVLKHESNKQQLGSDNEDYLGCGQSHYQKGNHNYNHTHNSTGQFVELLNNSLGIIQGKCAKVLRSM